MLFGVLFSHQLCVCTCQPHQKCHTAVEPRARIWFISKNSLPIHHTWPFDAGIKCHTAKDEPHKSDHKKAPAWRGDSERAIRLSLSATLRLICRKKHTKSVCECQVSRRPKTQFRGTGSCLRRLKLNFTRLESAECVAERAALVFCVYCFIRRTRSSEHLVHVHIARAHRLRKMSALNRNWR